MGDTIKSFPVPSPFPFLSPAKFDEACRKIQTLWSEQGAAQDRGEWESVQIVRRNDTLCLSVAKQLSPRNDNDASCRAVTEIVDPDDEPSLEDDDEQVVRRNGADGQARLTVHYDVVLSSTYQVPVLYFAVLDTRGHRRPLTASTAQDLLVPRAYRPQMNAVGVMGALTISDHPVTGVPAYFVHPCQTADAMRASCSEKSISPLDYLLKWIGIVGGSVGLSIPLSLAIAAREIC